ncbi:MAG: octaprenyl diphosphate synthase, partial [Deltaproteobacteria bacterium]|nr:octaprenyl diphosphate synthase [Deltaproteobacteria bacterium]
IVEREQLSDADLDVVCALIDSYKGIEYTRRRAAERITLAKACLKDFPAGEVRDALFALADYVVARNK